MEVVNLIVNLLNRKGMEGGRRMRERERGGDIICFFKMLVHLSAYIQMFLNQPD